MYNIRGIVNTLWHLRAFPPAFLALGGKAMTDSSLHAL